MIYIESKKRKLEKIKAQYPDAEIIDAPLIVMTLRGFCLVRFILMG